MLPAPGPPAEEIQIEPAVPDGLAGFAERLGAVETAVKEFHRRSAHRESVIDRLHEENQSLRTGMRREVLEPVVADLVRLHDGLAAQAEQSSSELFASFADDVVLALDRCGIEVVTARRGEAFTSGLHAVGSVEECSDPALHNTVAVPLLAGLRDRETGRIRRLAKATFYRVTETEA
jgi:molecular chaperone GrpE